jgi:hypothetical protein
MNQKQSEESEETTTHKEINRQLLINQERRFTEIAARAIVNNWK